MASSSEPESWLERSVAASLASWCHNTRFSQVKDSLVNTIRNKGGDYTTMQAIILADIRDLKRDIGDPAAIVTFTDKNAADKVLKLLSQDFHKLELADVKIRRAFIHTQGQDAEFLRSPLCDNLEKKHGIKVQHDETRGIFFDGYPCQITFLQRKLKKPLTLTIGKKEQVSGDPKTTAVRTHTETRQAPGGQDMAHGDAAKRSDRSADLQRETNNTVTCSKIEMLYILKQWGKEGARNRVYRLEPVHDTSLTAMEGGIRVTSQSKAGKEEGMQYIESIISAARHSSGIIRKYMFQFKYCEKLMVSKARQDVAEMEKSHQNVACHIAEYGIDIMGPAKDAWAFFVLINEKYRKDMKLKSTDLKRNMARYIAEFEMESIANVASEYELDYSVSLQAKPRCIAFMLFSKDPKYDEAECEIQKIIKIMEGNISQENLSGGGTAAAMLAELSEFAAKKKVLFQYWEEHDLIELIGPQVALDKVLYKMQKAVEMGNPDAVTAGSELSRDAHTKTHGKSFSEKSHLDKGNSFSQGALGNVSGLPDIPNPRLRDEASSSKTRAPRVKTPPADYPGADTDHSTGTRSPDVQECREASLVTADQCLASTSRAQSSQVEPSPQSQTSGSLATLDSRLAGKPSGRSGTSSPISTKHDKSVSSCPSPTTTAPTPRPNPSATKENSSSRGVDTAISSKGVKTTGPKVPGGAVRMVSSTSTPDSADVSKGSSTARTGDSSAAKPQIADPQGHSSDTRSQRSDAASQRSDAAGQRSNKVGQGSDASGQRSVTGGQSPGAAGQRSDATGQGPDTQGQRSDTPGQESDTRGQRSDAAGQRSDAAGQRSGAADQRSGTTGQRSGTTGQGSDTVDQRSGAAGQGSDTVTAPPRPAAPPRTRWRGKGAGDVASPPQPQVLPVLHPSAAHTPFPVGNDEFDEELPPPNVPATTFIYSPSKARVHALVADITKATTVAIVSASNSQLKAGGGVAKAIADAAGPELMKECARYIQKYRGLNVTDNCTTRGGELNAKYVIHAVGPSKRGQVSHEKLLQDLRMTFVNCLDTANNRKCYTIAIPAISSGNFGVPLEDAAREMVAGVLCFLDNEKNLNISDIFLVDVRPEMVKLIHQNLKSYDALKLKEPQGVLPTDGATLVKQCAKPLATEEEDSCVVCMSPFTHPKRLKTCGHTFCHDCLVETFSHKPSCPVCNTMYGTTSGSQPDSGRMTVEKEAGSLPGYPHSRTIVIDYNIPSGVQQANHPNPGEWYKGSYRQAFLPNNQEGKEVLKMLQRAFEQRLVFTIGRSSTTGKENVVTWNDIHHKTRRDGGPQKFGYPDPTYLARVKEELAAKGIKEED